MPRPGNRIWGTVPLQKISPARYDNEIASLDMAKRTRLTRQGVVRIADVARLAGVSATTVSRTLARPEVVIEETRTRVLAGLMSFRGPALPVVISAISSAAAVAPRSRRGWTMVVKVGSQ